MTILLAGLSHHTAPVEIRERAWIHDDQIHDAFQKLRNCPIEEAVILSTCNRLELYAVAPDDANPQKILLDVLTCIPGLSTEEFIPYLYFREDSAVTQHLMRVAAGLDSMILGEPQILGQVNTALNNAQQFDATGPVLSHLFAQAVHAGKRARTETEISRHSTSVSHASIHLVERILNPNNNIKAVVVGAGEMAHLAARALQIHENWSITCINRTFASAETLAKHVQGTAVTWEHLQSTFEWADLIITATGAPEPIICQHTVENALTVRQDKPLVLVDIAVPRNIEQSVTLLPNVQLFDIDDLEAAVEANRAQREATIPTVEAIIQSEAQRFDSWLRSRHVVPTIVDLRRHAEQVAQTEVEQALRQLDSLSDREQQVINRMALRIVNKLLHEPTIRLKAEAAQGQTANHALAIRELFALDEIDGSGVVSDAH